MSRKFQSTAAVAAIALLLSNELFAQTVIIAFSGPLNVPLDAWTSVGAALAIAAAAYAYFRRRRGGAFGRLSTWLVVATAATGAALVASRVDVISAVQAALAPTQVVLTTSPASVEVGDGSALLEVHNGTDAPVRIQSITLQNPARGQGFGEAPAPQCRPGLLLQVNALCNIFVGFNEV